MAIMPDSMRLTDNEQSQLDQIRADAKVRHGRERKAAKRAGRKYFPELPHECSWAYEEEFRRNIRKG